MKIAILCIEDLSHITGTIHRTKMIQDLISQYYQTTTITRGPIKEQSDQQIVITPGNTKLWNFKLFKHLLHRDFDVIICSNDWYGFLTCFLLRPFKKYKILFDAHSVLSQEARVNGGSRLKVLLRSLIEKIVIKHSDHVTVLSRETYDYYKSYNPQISEISVLLDGKLYQNSNHIPSSPSKKIGVIGPFTSPSNRNTLEFIHENLDRFHENFSFCFLGPASPDYTVNNPRLKLLGFLEEENYIHSLAEMDAILVIPENITSGPLTKIIEPMALSIPVFATPKAVFGLDHVIHENNIFIYEEGEIIEKINELIFNDTLMEEIALNSRHLFETHFSKEANGKKLTSILESLK